MSSTGIKGYLDAYDCGLSPRFKGLGAVVNALTGIKNASLHFQLKMNTQGFLIIPSDKNEKV
jgi:hypothetical protein